MYILDHFVGRQTDTIEEDRYLLGSNRSIIAEVYTSFEYYSKIEGRREISVSCMNGCPVHCGYCGTGNLPIVESFKAEEIVEQVDFVVREKKISVNDIMMISFTRQGEPFLNLKEVQRALQIMRSKYKNARYLISTIGLKDVDYSWISGKDMYLQLTIQGTTDAERNILVPYTEKATLTELGKIRTGNIKENKIRVVCMCNYTDELFKGTVVGQHKLNTALESLKLYFDSNYFQIYFSARYDIKW